MCQCQTRNLSTIKTKQDGKIKPHTLKKGISKSSNPRMFDRFSFKSFAVETVKDRELKHQELQINKPIFEKRFYRHKFSFVVSFLFRLT